MGFCGLWLGELGSVGWVFGGWGVVDGFNVCTLIINLLTVITTFDQSNRNVDKSVLYEDLCPLSV